MIAKSLMMSEAINPIDSRNLSNEINLKTVNALITACNKNNSLVHKYIN